MFKSQVKMYQIFNNDSPKSRKRLLSNDMDVGYIIKSLIQKFHFLLMILILISDN